MRVRPIVLVGAHGAPGRAAHVLRRPAGILAYLASAATLTARVELEAIITRTLACVSAHLAVRTAGRLLWLAVVRR